MASIDPQEVVQESQAVFNYYVGKSFKEWISGAPSDKAVTCTVDTSRGVLDLVTAGMASPSSPTNAWGTTRASPMSPLCNWHQALYMCILYDKWLEPPVWDFVEHVLKGFRAK